MQNKQKNELIVIHFAGYHLIALIRSWQNILYDVAAQKGWRTFHFNTYIISVLVIFFLQVNYNFPKLSHLPPSQIKFIDHVPKVDENSLKRAIVQFFEFYGQIYAIQDVISVHNGRWEDRSNESINFDQSRFVYFIRFFSFRFYIYMHALHSFPMKASLFLCVNFRLRERAKSNQANCDDCTMFVQDLTSPGTNITVEITKEEADNFKEICKILASQSIHEQVIDEYVLKLSELRSSSNLNVVIPMEKSVTEFSEASLQSLKRFKVEIEKRQNLDEGCFSKNDATTRLVSSQENVLQDAFNVDEILKFINIEMDQFLSSSMSRTTTEHEIINILSHLKAFNSAIISVTPFGSAVYGFGGQKTNFNILITTGRAATIHSLYIEIFNQHCIDILQKRQQTHVLYKHRLRNF